MTPAASPPAAGSATRPATVDEFLARHGPDERVELVDGEVVYKHGDEGPMSPTGGGHGVVVLNLIYALERHVRPGRSARVFTDPVAFVLRDDPPLVRCPDVALVRADRLPAEVPTAGLLRLAPDLAAEVIPPSEAATELEDKVDQYLAAGARLVWTLDPRRRTAQAFTAGGAVARLREGDALGGADVVPGFALPLADAFEGVARG